jgi:hypothetical protein
MITISKSKDGKRAQVVEHGVDQHGKKTSQTHHVRLSGTQWEKRSVNVDNKEVVIKVWEAGQ